MNACVCARLSLARCCTCSECSLSLLQQLTALGLMMSSQERRIRREGEREDERGKEGRKEGGRAARLPLETAEPRAGRSHLRKGQGVDSTAEAGGWRRLGRNQTMYVVYYGTVHSKLFSRDSRDVDRQKKELVWLWLGLTASNQ